MNIAGVIMCVCMYVYIHGYVYMCAYVYICNKKNKKDINKNKHEPPKIPPILL